MSFCRLICISFFLFLFSSFSWGACVSGVFEVTLSPTFYYICGEDCPPPTEDVCPSSYHNTWGGDYWLSRPTSYNNSSGCPYYSADASCSSGYKSYVVRNCVYSYKCDTEQEASCDSTQWSCNTTTETTQTTVASDDIRCFNGDCYGTVYCEYKTINTTECRNECGTITSQISEMPAYYEGRCDDENLDDDGLCSPVKCVTSNGFYNLYKVCKSHNIINGENQLLPRFVGGGAGTCVNAGYPEESNSSSSSDSSSVPIECYTMGINCPVPSDTTDYSDPDNRNPENGCHCQKYDGLPDISQIVCPDGSVSMFFGSCDNWNRPPSSSSANPQSSSSSPPESSSSGSENPPASSGGSTDWVNYSQGEQIKSALGLIALNTEKQNILLNKVLDGFSDYTDYTSDNTPNMRIPDSMLVLAPDSQGLNSIAQMLADTLFSRLDGENDILDTLVYSYNGCPTVTFFAGNANTSFSGGHIRFQEMSVNLCNVSGYNFIRIAQVFVVGLASVVSFFIGFSIFKNVSQ